MSHKRVLIRQLCTILYEKMTAHITQSKSYPSEADRKLAFNVVRSQRGVSIKLNFISTLFDRNCVIEHLTDYTVKCSTNHPPSTSKATKEHSTKTKLDPNLTSTRGIYLKMMFTTHDMLAHVDRYCSLTYNIAAETLVSLVSIH